MATLKDLDALALAMPQAAKAVSDDGRPSYSVHGKYFCFHRSRRPDAVDAKTGERLDDVLVFRVEDVHVKDLVLGDDRGIFFTTPHWNGYPAVLLRIRDLRRLKRADCAIWWSTPGSPARRSASPGPGSPRTSRPTTDRPYSIDFQKTVVSHGRPSG